MAGRYDKRDVDRRELRLIRVGHYLWALRKRESLKSRPLSEERASWDGLQAVWGAKRTLRREISAERAIQAKIVRERFARAR
jgi:hypothetical protein